MWQMCVNTVRDRRAKYGRHLELTYKIRKLIPHIFPPSTESCVFNPRPPQGVLCGCIIFHQRPADQSTITGVDLCHKKVGKPRTTRAIAECNTESLIIFIPSDRHYWQRTGLSYNFRINNREEIDDNFDIQRPEVVRDSSMMPVYENIISYIGVRLRSVLTRELNVFVIQSSNRQSNLLVHFLCILRVSITVFFHQYTVQKLVIVNTAKICESQRTDILVNSWLSLVECKCIIFG